MNENTSITAIRTADETALLIARLRSLLNVSLIAYSNPDMQLSDDDTFAIFSEMIDLCEKVDNGFVNYQRLMKKEA